MADPDVRPACNPNDRPAQTIETGPGATATLTTVSRPPSVDQLARSLESSGLPHPLRVEVARHAIATDRVDEADDLARARADGACWDRSSTPPGSCSTPTWGGPRSASSWRPPTPTSSSTSSPGRRGSRQRAVGDLLATAAGAEAAMVVNNCAGAVLLTLAALGAGRGVAVSRGEMVEIGGGFRIPDVMNQSGAGWSRSAPPTGAGSPTTPRPGTPTGPGHAAQGPPLELPPSSASPRTPRSTSWPPSGCRSWPTSARACSTRPAPGSTGRRRPGWRVSRRPARPWPPGPTWCCSAATSSSADPRPGSSPARRELVERCGKHPLARALRPGRPRAPGPPAPDPGLPRTAG